MPHYEYDCKLIKVVDGDTLDLDVDLGFFLTNKIRARLGHINAPEVTGITKTKGLEAKDFVVQWCQGIPMFTVQTYKDYSREKYGRYLAVLFRPGDLVTLGQALLNAELAVPYMVLAQG